MKWQKCQQLKYKNITRLYYIRNFKYYIYCFFLSIGWGFPTPPFISHMGIRQGDPTAPILVDLVIGNLSRLIIDWERIREKKVDTYIVNGATSISHLIYADNMLIFTKANPKSLGKIKEILRIFSNFFAVEVNQEKISAIYSKICSDDQILHKIPNFPTKALPINYLGLRITGRKKTHSVCWKQ